jgi:hypothetical protein
MHMQLASKHQFKQLKPARVCPRNWHKCNLHVGNKRQPNLAKLRCKKCQGTGSAPAMCGRIAVWHNADTSRSDRACVHSVTEPGLKATQQKATRAGFFTRVMKAPMSCPTGDQHTMHIPKGADQ